MSDSSTEYPTRWQRYISGRVSNEPAGELARGRPRSDVLVEERREAYTEHTLKFMSNCSTGGLSCVGAT
jgi:hypothetical protein